MTTACPQLSWQSLQKHDYTSEKKTYVCAKIHAPQRARGALRLLSCSQGGRERFQVAHPAFSDVGERQKVDAAERA